MLKIHVGTNYIKVYLLKITFPSWFISDYILGKFTASIKILGYGCKICPGTRMEICPMLAVFFSQKLKIYVEIGMKSISM